jgi:hypothetical protein
MSDSSDQDAAMTTSSETMIIDLIRADRWMLDVLEAVRSLELPDGWIAAGFIRNRVWDRLHGFEEPTPLNDIDVVYFDPEILDEDVEKQIEARLRRTLPGEPWSVKNQARMAVVNGDPPYADSAHALTCWCETPTPIGARLTGDDHIELIAPLGLDDLFDLIVRPTPHAMSHPHKLAQYRERMARKDWPRLWPRVKVLNL